MRTRDGQLLDWAEIVTSNDLVAWPQASGEPTTLVRSFLAYARHRDDLECFVGIPAGETWAPEAVGGLALRSYTGSGINRQLMSSGQMTLERVDYSALPGLLSTGRLRVDVLLLRVPTPDSEGRINLGPTADYHHAAIATARTIVVEIDPAMPWILDAPELPGDLVTAFVESTDTSPVMGWQALDQRAQQIARNAAAWIADGATLQLGVGSLPGGVLAHVGQRKDLGVHSGMVPDAIVSLATEGVVTGRHNPRDPGKLVAGSLMGSARLMRWADHEPRLAVRPTGYTHDAEVLADQHRLTAVNAALQVDLQGQVNAESVGGRYVGALGGALDFGRGASRSAGGVSLTLIRAQGRHGSNIVEDVGDNVTVPSADVGVVVTEFGSADLRGCDTDEIRRRLLAVAGPM